MFQGAVLTIALIDFPCYASITDIFDHLLLYEPSLLTAYLLPFYFLPPPQDLELKLYLAEMGVWLSIMEQALSAAEKTPVSEIFEPLKSHTPLLQISVSSSPI